MIRRPKRSSTANKKKLETQELLIRENTATLYGIYFATSNTDFLLEEKKTRFSVRPNVILNTDRVTTIFDYSGIVGSNQEAIFDGFFRGLSAGVTLGLDGGIESTASYINEMNNIPLTDFADTYTIKTIDVEKKILIAEKSSAISSTTAVSFDGNYFIDLPQFTKTANNEESKSVNKIINLLPNQSLTHIGVRVGSILEFKKTVSNNRSYTVKSIRIENGFEVIEVEEPITKEDATQTQIILSVYETEENIQRQENIVTSIDDFGLVLPGNRLNECCPCMDCLYRSIREVESGGEARNGCDAPCTNNGLDCGPYQIRCSAYIKDICKAGGPCSRGNSGYDSTCCEVCQTGYCDALSTPCPAGDGPEAQACCAEKQRRSEKLMDCWFRRYLRNPNRNCLCSGNIIHDYPDGDLRCCTCEDIARRHNGGPILACRSNTDAYWAKVKARMVINCPTCSTDVDDGLIWDVPYIPPDIASV